MDLLSLTKELDKIVEESFGVPLQDQVNAMATRLTPGMVRAASIAVEYGDPSSLRSDFPDARKKFEIRSQIMRGYRRYLRSIDYDEYRERWVVYLNSGRIVEISAEMAPYGRWDSVQRLARVIEEYIRRDDREYPMYVADEEASGSGWTAVTKDFKFNTNAFIGIDLAEINNVEPPKCKSCKGHDHGSLDRKGRCTVTAKDDFQKTIRRLSLYRQMKNKQVVSAS